MGARDVLSRRVYERSGQKEGLAEVKMERLAEAIKERVKTIDKGKMDG